MCKRCHWRHACRITGHLNESRALGKPFILEEFNVAYNGAHTLFPPCLFCCVVGQWSLLLDLCTPVCLQIACQPPGTVLTDRCPGSDARPAEEHRNQMFELVQRLFQADIAEHPEDSAAAGVSLLQLSVWELQRALLLACLAQQLHIAPAASCLVLQERRYCRPTPRRWGSGEIDRAVNAYCCPLSFHQSANST